MRFLLVNNHCISDRTAGVTQSLRTIMEWLHDAGHGCEILTTARFESGVPFTIGEHLREQGVDVSTAKRSVVRYTVGDVPVTLLLTRHNDETRPNRAESTRYGGLVESLLNGFACETNLKVCPTAVMIACNGHPMIRAALASARGRGITTAFAVRGFGYYDPRFFEDVDHVFTCSQFLTDVYREKAGVISTPLEPPIDWSTVVAPKESRAFLTFVHPSPHKGLFLFARLADMLGSRRPDIPILVVQSGHTAGALNAIAGLDFSRYPQIMAAPPVPAPSDYFALTRILLVPSVWDEPFGRVAAEAMINGVPPIVSARGSLPHVVGGDVSTGGAGIVLPLPEWMTPDTTRLPSEEEVQPWFDAVCRLWDDARHYATIAARARAMAGERYSEEVSRRKHVNYFTSLKARPADARPVSTGTP
jgi:glycosyltransferase involved in cell wall biosynthesis